MSFSVSSIIAIVFAAIIATIASANAAYLNIVRENIRIGVSEQNKIIAEAFFWINIVVAVLAFAYLIIYVIRMFWPKKKTGKYDCECDEEIVESTVRQRRRM